MFCAMCGANIRNRSFCNWAVFCSVARHVPPHGPGTARTWRDGRSAPDFFLAGIILLVGSTFLSAQYSCRLNR